MSTSGHIYGHLYWRILLQMEDRQFAQILWCIWQGRNNKVFTNIDIDSRDTLKLAETESLLWVKAHSTIINRVSQNREIETTTLPSIPDIWCFTDGSWKDKDRHSGQGWHNTLEGFDGLLVARNTKARLSSLHLESKSVYWAMKCVKNLPQFQVPIHNISFSIGEDGFRTIRIARFCKLFGRNQDLEKKFPHFRAHSYTKNDEFKGRQSCTQC